MAEVVTLDQMRRRKVYRTRHEAHEDDYKKLHRFTKCHVEWISQHFIGPPNGERRGGSLNPCQRMEITLRYLGDPGFQIGVAQDVPSKKISLPDYDNCRWYRCHADPRLSLLTDVGKLAKS